MTKLPEKLRLKGLAEEDVYFARRDRELIEALHRQKLARHPNVEKKKSARQKAKALQKAYAEVTADFHRRPKKFAKCLRRLVRKARKLVSGV